MTGTTSEDRKQKIRERYKGVDQTKITVIPAKEEQTTAIEQRKLRVAAYVRVSTDNEEQTSSFELQKDQYYKMIEANPNWTLVDIYADEGISGTEMSHRAGMLRMLEDARAGKIDLILAKSISRFARNLVDCVMVIEELQKLNPPVGIKFETDNIYTLDSTGSLLLKILATLAEEESHTKSEIMNWSITSRFRRGLFLTPPPTGFDLDEDGNLVINPEESEIVKVIYYLFINGYSLDEIASVLTQSGKITRNGNKVWSPGSIDSIIGNERNCGDVLARKTYTPNFKDHKAVKNRNNREQVYQKDHHDPIVSRDVFNAANLLRSARSYRNRKKKLPVLSVIDDGVLKGYIPINKDWQGFSTEDYKAASESVVDTNAQKEGNSKEKDQLSGYELVRSNFFPSFDTPVMNISNGRIRFNTASLKLFEDVEYVELLLNTVSNRIVIRPCDQSSPNAIRWGRLKEDRWTVYKVAAKGLYKTLFDLNSWEEDVGYRFIGHYYSNDKYKFLMFDLEEPVATKTVLEVTAEENDDLDADNTDTRERKIRGEIILFPPSWENTFGLELESVGQLNVLSQVHYLGDWDILRPPKSIDSLNKITESQLNDYLYEAQKIIERWMRDAEQKPN